MLASSRRRLLRHATALAALPLVGRTAAAAGMVKVVVPYAPGAATDALARMLCQALEEPAGPRYLVDNRAGGGTQIGTRAIATAAPDGSTLGFVDTAFVINPGLYGSALPYDTRQDFTPISLTATAPFVLLVPRRLPAGSVDKLVALAATREGGLSYGSAGVGSAPHLAGEQLRMATRMAATHVPYRGGSTVLTDMIAGHIDFGFTTVPTMLEQIRTGSVRPLAVTGQVRARQLPDVPTMAELRLPSVDAAPLFGLVAPAGLPAAQRQTLGEKAGAVVRSGPLHAKLNGLGFRPVGSTPAEFQARIEAEIAKWTQVIAEGGIKPGS